MKHAVQREPGLLARFRKEFAALYGGEPFPWQERLFGRLCEGDIPFALDLPTGLGKTSVMAIWLMARALASDAARKSIPRRLAYVVDRRAVVDQATTEARKLRCWLARSGADLLPALNLAGRKLPVSTLRGQLADNREWRENPAGCAIVVGTVDMIGSRILFSGYGVSPNMRPYHAGFLGADTLVVLDESHLVPPFEMLLMRIEHESQHAFGPKSAEERKIVPAFKVMCLSATGARPSEPERVFSLKGEDYEHNIVRKRLAAPKYLTIDHVPTDDPLAERLAARAWTLGTKPTPARVLVYCDSREDALKVKDEIQKRAGRRSEPPQLLVGQRRVYEREALVGWLEKNGFVGDASHPPDTPTFLVATSAGEVGVDLDADHLVCDLVEWERMVQRLGRVNRRGYKQSRIEVIPAAAKDKKKGAENWEKRLPQLLAPLNELQALEDGRDASPSAIAQLRAKSDLQGLLQNAESRKPLYPALTRALIEAWAMTSIEQHSGRPDIQPWLRGWEEEEPQCTIVWRQLLPLRNGKIPPDEHLNDFFEAAPLQLSEMLETETWRAVDWAVARATATRRGFRRSEAGQYQSAPEDDMVAVLVLDRKGRFERHYTLVELVELERSENKKDREHLRDMLNGKTLVVSCRLRGLDSRGMLSDDSNDEPLTVDNNDDWAVAANFRVRETIEVTPTDDENWHEFYRLPLEYSEDRIETRWIIVEQPRALGQTEESLAVARKAQRLDQHHARAAAAACRLAHALDLQAPYDGMLAIAAKIHDEGKKARCWQRAFHARPDAIYAKTIGPVNIRLLEGYRHEFGSLLGAERNPELLALAPDVRDLALHLIAAHHGNARPLISPLGCEAGPPSILQGKACDAALRFGRLQKQWGPWGLAWWEALLRSIDQQVSRDNDASDERASVKVEETV